MQTREATGLILSISPNISTPSLRSSTSAVLLFLRPAPMRPGIHIEVAEDYLGLVSLSFTRPTGQIVLAAKCRSSLDMNYQEKNYFNTIYAIEDYMMLLNKSYSRGGWTARTLFNHAMGIDSDEDNNNNDRYLYAWLTWCDCYLIVSILHGDIAERSSGSALLPPAVQCWLY